MSVMLWFGPDEFRRSEALKQFCASIPPEVADLNISRLEGRRLRADGLAAACGAMPFLADRRIVIVADLLKQLKAGSDRDEIIAYLAEVPAWCDLILIEREEVDRRGALFKWLQKHAEVREFTSPEGPDRVRWLHERASLAGVRFEGAAAQRLFEYVGNDGRALANEVQKLASYVGHGGRIDVAAIERLVQDDQEQNLFAFIDALSMRRRAEALGGLRQLLADGQAAPYLLFMLARQIRILLGVKALASQRMRPEQIANELGQKPFVVRKAADQARNFAAGELERLHDRMLEYDHALKTGRIQAETALELLVMEMSSPSRERA